MKKGWQKRQLGELAELRGRIGWRGLTAKEYTKEGPLFLSVHSLNYGDYVDFRDAFHISEERYVESPEIMLQRDDVLICKDGAGIGKVGIVGDLPERTTINSSLLLIRSGKDILPKFLYRCLSSPYFQKIVQSRLNGATTPHLYQRDITEFPVVLPPLAEQQRIVGVLDEAFAGLATAQAHAAQNLQNARALFESHLQSVFTHRSKGWVETTLGEAYDVRDGTHDSPKYHATGFPLITSKNLKPDGLSFDDVKLISETDYDKINERSAVHRGDVLFAMIGTIGNPTLVEVEPRFAIKNVALFKVPTGQSSRFLKHYLDSGQVKSKMAKEAKGTTQKFVGLGYLRNFPLLLPPLETQNDIVEELDALAAETQRLTRLYEQKQAALAALKKSLLHQAFTGEL